MLLTRTAMLLSDICFLSVLLVTVTQAIILMRLLVLGIAQIIAGPLRMHKSKISR